MKTDLTRLRARLMGGAATSIALLLSAGMAHAQTPARADAPEDGAPVAVDELVVTGIRAGIENSIAVKKNEASIVEVVSAEDIGKLPDVSIAEAIARLPGVTAQRLNGRAQVISIRGLGPDFTSALLNGREQVSAGDNRGVEFDQYPSELLNSVIIYKTPDAALIGQGLAGTADLRTVRPLQFGRRAFAANARYEVNDIGALNAGTDDTGSRVSISYIDQFFDGRLGLALGYAHMDSPYQAERFNAWGYPGVAGGDVIGGAKPYVQSSELVRDGYMAVLEFSPNDQVHSTLDVLYSKFEFTEILRGIELPLQWSSASLQPGYTVQNGLVTSGQFNGVKGVVRNDANTRDSTLTSVGWNTTIKFSDQWSAELDVNHSSIDREDVVLETYAGTGRSGSGATDNMGFTTNSSGTRFTSILDYSDYGQIFLTSPQGWGGDVIPGGQAGYYNSPSINDELNAIRLSAVRTFGDGFLKSIEVGYNRTSREKSLTANEFFLDIGAPTVAVPVSARLGVTSLNFLGIDGMISYDPLALLNSGIYTLVRNPNGDVAAKDWLVEEDVSTAFIKADFNTEIGSVGVSGNFGFQVVSADQNSSAFAATGTGAGTVTVPVSGGAEYTEVLPSLNVTLALPYDQYLRFAAARTLARPRMDEMRASFTYNYDSAKAGSTDLNNSPWSGGGGNPELEPWIAKAFDISYEKYFGRRAYVAVSLYYKDLESYIYNQTEVYDFTGFPVGGGPAPALRQGFVNTPQNGEGGEIKGVEFSISMPVDMVLPVPEGFGVIFSASKAESEIRPNGPTSAPTPLPGLSETVVNGTLYYERDGFQARISNRYRSDFLGEVAVFANGRGLRMVDSENVVDAQIGYQFQEGVLDGLSVLLQVNNLTDEPFSTFQNTETRVIDYQRYGRTVLFGVNYRF